MYDGFKIQDVSVSAHLLLTNDRLLFPLPLDEQTGVVLTERPRRAEDRGLTFTLMPVRANGRPRCELQGSLHRYHNHGHHNADDFTVTDLLATVDELVTTYSINPFLTQLNNVEFGVNVQLPFPVSQVLNNLISYKYRPFVRVRESGDGYAYYQAVTQRYILKVYDKGEQYNQPGNVLRLEIKVLKMEYLTRRGVHLNTLADLLTVGNYGPLGALLVETFNHILFDESTINPAVLISRERDIYQKGSNPRFWSISDNLTSKEYERHRKALQRTETKFRALLDRCRQGDNWQTLTTALISQTWERLATVDDDLLTRISERQSVWQDLVKHSDTASNTPEKCPKLTGVPESAARRETVEKCPKLTGSDDDQPIVEMSQINPQDVVLIWDNAGLQQTSLNAGRGTPAVAATSIPQEGYALIPQVKREIPVPVAAGAVAGAVVSVTDSNADNEGLRRTSGQRVVVEVEPASKEPGGRPTALVLRANPDLLAQVEQGRRRYAKGSKEDAPMRAAHNLRNDDSNPRNNLRGSINKIHRQPTLFDVSDTLRLTADQRAVLDHWQGTPFELQLLKR